MKKSSVFLGLILCAASFAAEKSIKIENADFESWGPVPAEKAAFIQRFAKAEKDLLPLRWELSGNRPPAGNAISGIARVENVRQNGKYALCVEGRFPQAEVMLKSTLIRMEPRKFYRVSCFVKGENIRFNRKKYYDGPRIEFTTGPDDFYKDRQTQFFKAPEGTFPWTKISRIFGDVRADNVKARIGVGLFRAEGKLWIDDLKLEEVSQEEFLKQEKQEISSKCQPTHWRIHYGPDERQIMNLYLPKTGSGTPSPVWIEIHGGGWLGGNGVKEAEQGNKDGTILRMNARGVAVAVINYRLGHLPNPVHDAARAVQFLRYHAKEFNLDKNRFLATGFSAGATTSMWLAVHDDMADPASKDPVARESSRLQGAIVRGVQSSIDPKVLKEWGIENAVHHAMITRNVGIPTVKDIPRMYAEKKPLYDEFSAINHLDRNDPKILILSGSPLTSKDWIHHPRFGLEFKKKAVKIGAPCDIYLHKNDQHLTELPQETYEQYVNRVLGLTEKKKK